MDKFLEKKIESYRKSYRKHGLSPKSLQWYTRQSAVVRYEQIVADCDFEGKSVLDVGCGFGDLIPFIEEKARDFRYKGVDVVPEFVKSARIKFPDYEFLINDYFGKPMDKKFDIVISCGTLNSRRKGAVVFRKKAIKTMFEHCKEAVVFNMAGGYPQPKNFKESRIYYADALKVLKFCLQLTQKVIFRYHYRRHDFTIVMFK